MVDTQDYLLTTCEVALGVTGFASLLLALAPRGRTPPAVYRFRIYSLLTGSVGCLFLALVTLALLAFGIDDVTAWRSSSALMVLLCAWSVIWAAPLGHRARRESTDWLSPNKVVLAILALATPVNTLLQATNSIFVFAPPFAVYFSGLVGFLLYAGIGLIQTLIDAVEGRSAA